MRRFLLLLLCLALIMGGSRGETTYDYDTLDVGNPTPLTGRFFTTIWGGTTSDLDVQHLLHQYTLTIWDEQMGRFRTNTSVIDGALASDDAEGNRTYIILLHDDLKYSDGSPIMARDYAFTLLFLMDEAIRDTGGIPADQDWLLGAVEYRRGEAETLIGVRILSDYTLAVTMTSESLPNFYELGRLNISPYPIAVLTPENEVLDDGEGVYLKHPITADDIRQTVLDPEIGYLVNPQVNSGPYKLESFDGTKATFKVNPYYKGNEDGYLPLIANLTYQGTDNDIMIQELEEGRYGLLNKVTVQDTIWDAVSLLGRKNNTYTKSKYPRTGLTVFRFMPDSVETQELAVRKAILLCMDRQSIVSQYVGSFGLPVDGLYGLGQWQTQLMMGTEGYPIPGLCDEATAEEIEEYEALEAEWEALSYDSVIKYTLDVDGAIQLLEDAGWKVNPETDIRGKPGTDGEEIQLTLRVAIPENEELRQALEEHWVGYLAHAGIGIEISTMGMRDLYDAYRERYQGASKNFDMILVGNNFTASLELKNSFRVNSVEQGMQGQEAAGEEETLEELNRRLYDQAAEVNHTEATDILGYMRKWIDLQAEISETIPVIPLYSNVYFDFYTRNLHEYHIEWDITWADAIVPAWMSDVEDLTELEREEIQSSLEETQEEFDPIAVGYGAEEDSEPLEKQQNSEGALEMDEALLEDELTMQQDEDIPEETTRPPDETTISPETGEQRGD